MFNFNFRRLNIFKNTNNGFRSRLSNAFSRFPMEYKVIKQEEISNFIMQDVCIIDVRTENEYKAMHIKNALNIPLNFINRDILNVVPDKDTKILIYCAVGERTQVAIQKLNSLGYRNIYIWGNGGLNTLKSKEILEY